MAQTKMTKLQALEMVNGLPRNIFDELAKGSGFSGGELAEKLAAMLDTEHKSAEKRAAKSTTNTVSIDGRKLYDIMVEKSVTVADTSWVMSQLQEVKTAQKATAMFRNLERHGYVTKSYSTETGHVQYTLTDKVMPQKEEN